MGVTLRSIIFTLGEVKPSVLNFECEVGWVSEGGFARGATAAPHGTKCTLKFIPSQP